MLEDRAARIQQQSVSLEVCSFFDMGRSPCCDNNGLKKGPWTPEEDQKLATYIQNYGHGTWRSLPHKAGLNRCGKSCRLRWNNYLKPIMYGDCVCRWSKIAAHLPGRTDNEVKNHWNTKLRRKLLKIGIDPQTHKPVVLDVNQLLHHSQLLSALNPVGSLMNMWTNALLSHVDATQLAKLQLVQNLLMAVNYAAPQPSSLIPPSMLIGVASSLPNADFLLPILNSDQAPSAALSPQNDNIYNFDNVNSYQKEDSVPGLFEVTTTPETSLNTDQANQPSLQLIDSFQTWEELLDQEDLWKEIPA